MTTIAQCLATASQQLQHLDEPRREAQALLCAIAEVSPSYLFTWPERELPAAQQQRFQQALQQRAQGMSLAYIMGTKEFWNFSLKVQPGVLVPRPETEQLLEACLEFSAYRPCGRLLDLGTGSGAIALAFAQERPQWQVLAIDASDTALAVAEANRAALGLNNVSIQKSHWFDTVQGEFDVIVSNPPYIDANEPELDGDGVKFEPREALVAAKQGLADIESIVQQAPHHLKAKAPLLIEHGYQQATAVQELYRQRGFYAVKTERDYAGLDRYTAGCWPG